MMDVGSWLRGLGLERYEAAFRENEIDETVLPSLTADDLKDLGIGIVGHRRKLLDAIAALRADANTKVPLSDTLPTIDRSPKDAAERRHLTVMICDLVGSTALSARLDPEDLRGVIGAYHTCIAEVIGRYQGIIARYMGDGVLVYFGYPQAHEDDAEQGVRAGLALVEAVANLRTDFDAALKVRIGIATGTVVVGDLIGEGAAQEQAVVGETPNLAARLQAAAEPSTVVISATTRQLTGGLFEYRDLGPVALKGWTEPTPAWQVVGASGAASRFEAQHTTRLTPLLGRDDEIEVLSRRWHDATQGEGRVVMLTGEPGIGKSHIALAFQERLQAEPHIRLRYYCSAHHTNSALFPFIGQLERAARFERGDAPAEKLAKLEALLMQSGVNAVHSVPILANLLALPPSERYPLPELSPQKRKEATLAALMVQLEGLSARQPVLVVFEDAHWIDPTSLELLAITVERLPQLRVLLLITARPEFAQPWPGHAHVTTLPLTRLNRRVGSAIIERIAAGKTLPEEVTNQILARTDGVPLFVEELTKTVLEGGLLQEQDDHYVLDRPLPALAIPTTLQASLMARLDRLAPVREVPQTNYTFKHVLVRDAAYSGLLKSRRAQLHAAIASAFEQRFPEIIQAEPETLAHHLMEAGLNEKAAGYWLQAGKNAAMRSANLEAIAHLQRGAEAVGHLPEGSQRDRRDLDFQFALGPCLIATQGPASGKAVATFVRARELCERLGDPPEYLQVMFWLVTASVVRGELPRAAEMIATLLRLAQAHGDRPALLNAMRGEAMILLFMGRLADARKAIEGAVEAFNASDEADRLAARSAGQDAGVADLALMSWALWLLGDVDTAVTRMTAAFQRAAGIEHPHTHAYACYYASVLHALRGEQAIAQGHAERCLALSEEHGFRQWRGLSRAIQGTCVTMLDPSSDTLKEVMGALEEYRGAGYQLGITALYVLLCRALLLLRQPEAALEVTEQGLATAVHNSERIFEAELYRLKARALLARGGSDARTSARPLLDQALMTASSQHARSLELRAATDLAALAIDYGRCDEARAILAPIYAWFTEGLETQDLKEAKAVLDQLR